MEDTKFYFTYEDEWRWNSIERGWMGNFHKIGSHQSDLNPTIILETQKSTQLSFQNSSPFFLISLSHLWCVESWSWRDQISHECKVQSITKSRDDRWCLEIPVKIDINILPPTKDSGLFHVMSLIMHNHSTFIDNMFSTKAPP